ncbi:MAG TPA: class I SAM-dependent methyltransferase, partial [Pyrinomonadaceae bacterium]|nr:class I SAM-dependent methyltransferase [Pyrinomonadaceae bacterium]
QTKAEADFIERQLDVAKGARVLDVPCGNGRLSLELAARGYQLTGVDFAAEFIAEAKANAKAADLAVDWQERDMRDLPWPTKFDGAFCFGNSFGYLDEEENEDFLKAVSLALKPEAVFILDAPATAECSLPTFAEHRSFPIGDITLAVDNRYDHEQSRLVTDYHFIRDGQDDCRPGSQRVYTYRELANLCRKHGLKVEASYSSLTGDPFHLGAHRLLLVCRKTSA